MYMDNWNTIEKKMTKKIRVRQYKNSYWKGQIRGIPERVS